MQPEEGTDLFRVIGRAPHISVVIHGPLLALTACEHALEGDTDGCHRQYRAPFCSKDGGADVPVGVNMRVNGDSINLVWRELGSAREGRRRAVGGQKGDYWTGDGILGFKTELKRETFALIKGRKSVDSMTMSAKHGERDVWHDGLFG